MMKEAIAANNTPQPRLPVAKKYWLYYACVTTAVTLGFLFLDAQAWRYLDLLESPRLMGAYLFLITVQLVPTGFYPMLTLATALGAKILVVDKHGKLINIYLYFFMGLTLPILFLWTWMVIGVLASWSSVIIALIFLMVWGAYFVALQKHWQPMDLTSYLLARDGNQKVFLRFGIEIGLQLLALLVVSFGAWHLYLSSVEYARYSTIIITLYHCVVAPIFTLWLQLKVMRRWFVVEDGDMLTQWLIAKQLAKHEVAKKNASG
jgi:hypothetical protein